MTRQATVFVTDTAPPTTWPSSTSRGAAPPASTRLTHHERRPADGGRDTPGRPGRPQGANTRAYFSNTAPPAASSGGCAERGLRPPTWAVASATGKPSSNCRAWRPASYHSPPRGGKRTSRVAQTPFSAVRKEPSPSSPKPAAYRTGGNGSWCRHRTSMARRSPRFLGEGGVILAAEAGGALTFVANGAISEELEGNRSFEPQQVLAGEDHRSLELPRTSRPPAQRVWVPTSGAPEYQFFSPDLSVALVEPYDPEPPLAPAVAAPTPYLRDDRPLAPEPAQRASYAQAESNSAFLAPGFAPLISKLTAPEAPPASGVRFIPRGASA